MQFAREFEKAGIFLEIPDLNGDDFTHLTVSSQLRIIRDLAGSDQKEKIRIIGSSLGGYLAALFATLDQRVERIFLMAPAFQFFKRQRIKLGEDALLEWEKSGYREFYHYTYEKNLPLSFEIVKEWPRFGSDFPFRDVKSYIVHGLEDESVSWEVSLDHAKQYSRTELKLIHADHSLLSRIDSIIDESFRFFELH